MTRSIYRWLIWGVAGFGALAGRGAEVNAEMPGTTEAIRVWHVADGLPSDAVTAVIQTPDGYLWIGTSAGLARFDGAKFTEIKPADGSTNRLTGVTALCEDSNGHLWIGTQQQGLFQLAGGRLVRYAARKGLVEGAVSSLAADSRGQVWIGGNNGLSLWTGEHFELFTKRDGLPDDSVSGVNVAHSGTVWITTRVGMCRFLDGRIAPNAFQTESQGRSPEYLGAYEDKRGNLWAFGDTYLINLTENKRVNYFRSSEPASLRIWSLCEGREGRLWIGTSGRGLFCFEDNHFQPVIFGEQRWPYDVRAICEDREGNLWLGTSGGGLAQLRPQSIQVLRMEQGLPDGLPTALALDGAGRIYVALQRDGLFVGESGRFDRLAGGAGVTIENFISSLSVGRDGTLWAATLGGGLHGWRNGRAIQLTTADGLADDNILAVCADGRGGVWASTGAGTVHCFTGPKAARFDRAQGLPGTPVTTMIPTAGGLWMGTEDGQILREQDGNFTNAEAAPGGGGHAVLALCEGVQRRLWIGTAGGGLSSLANGMRVNWNTNNGLPSDFVAGVVEDGETNLWLVTGAGICRVDHVDVRNLRDHPGAALACKLILPAKTMSESPTASGGPRAAVAFVNATPNRSPMTDWYQTTNARKVGFTARPVIGGVFLQMLYDQAVWQKYAARDKTKAAKWAAIPAPQKITVIIPAADTRPAVWSYATSQPGGDWMNPRFDDSSWKQGPGGFGSAGTPGAIIGTAWQTGDIWLRREVDLPMEGAYDELQAWFYHDEDAEVYLNGVLALRRGGYISRYDTFPLTPEARAALKPGKNLIAIHCHQTVGGQYVDFGLVDVQAN